MKPRCLATHALFSGILAFAVVGLTGCEWEGSGDGDFWSEKYEFLNFSGVYRPRGSSIILSYEPEGVVDEGIGIAIIEDQTVGIGNGVKTTFGGVLASKPLVPGSLSITAGGFHLVDNGSGALAGSGATGNIDYGTGSWAIDLGGVPLDLGVVILANYRYMTGGGGGSAKPGSSHPIYQFTVQQTGNRVTLIDNYGQSYEGKLAAVDTVHEGEYANQRQQINQSFSFTAEGLAHGMRIRIVGAFLAQQTVHYSQGDDDTRTELYRIVSFVMDGTWIEPSGKTGRIDAVGPANQRIQVQ